MTVDDIQGMASMGWCPMLPGVAQGAPSPSTTWPRPPMGIALAENNEEESGVKGQPTGGNPMFRPPVLLYQYRSTPGKFPHA